MNVQHRLRILSGFYHQLTRRGPFSRFCSCSRSNTISRLAARRCRDSCPMGYKLDAHDRGRMMNAELLIDYSEFWSRLSKDIGSARRSVFVQTFASEGDAIGKQLSAALLASTAA